MFHKQADILFPCLSLLYIVDLYGHFCVNFFLFFEFQYKVITCTILVQVFSIIILSVNKHLELSINFTYMS